MKTLQGRVTVFPMVATTKLLFSDVFSNLGVNFFLSKSENLFEKVKTYFKRRKLISKGENLFQKVKTFPER